MSQIDTLDPGSETRDLHQRLFQKGVDLLAMREHSEFELAQKLRSKAFPSGKSRSRKWSGTRESQHSRKASHPSGFLSSLPKEESALIADSVVAKVIAELKELRYLSDERFAEMFIRSRIERGFGPIKIRFELAQKKISESLIDHHLNQDTAFWIEQASQLCLKKYRKEPISDYNSWSKRARFLQTRGFSFDHIHSALGEVEYI